MSQDPFKFNFPFVNMIPDDMGAANLMLNSMKMMGQAWQNFTSAAPQASAMAMDPNELDKRIEELKSVESWLKLNLSMLSNSIHSLEIQKANLEHFNSMMEIMSEPIKAAQSSSIFTSEQSQHDDKIKPTAEKTATKPSKTTGEKTENASDEQTNFAETSNLVQDQALNWFSLLGDQFKNIVASVAANTPTEFGEEKADEQSVKKPQQQTKRSETTAKKTTTRTAKKTSATKKATAKKSSGSIAKKTVVTKKAATKKADDQ